MTPPTRRQPLTLARVRQQLAIQVLVGLAMGILKVTYLGIRFGWRIETFTHADFGFFYAFAGVSSVLWVLLRVAEAISK